MSLVRSSLGSDVFTYAVKKVWIRQFQESFQLEPGDPIRYWLGHKSLEVIAQEGEGLRVAPR